MFVKIQFKGILSHLLHIFGFFLLYFDNLSKVAKPNFARISRGSPLVKLTYIKPIGKYHGMVSCVLVTLPVREVSEDFT